MAIKRWGAIAAFFIIGPLLTEFLTGNVSFAVFQDPIAVAALSISYGGGGLLIRETARRWGKGYPSIVLLGISYGIVNEAIQSGGFFDPKFYSVVELGLENFGRWAGINVVWALGITAFHAVYSITIPIVIVDALFGSEQRYLRSKVLICLFFIFVLDSAFLMFVGNHIFAPRPSPDPKAVVSVIILMLLFIGAARMFPRIDVVESTRPGTVLLFVSGFAGSAVFFFSYIKAHQYLLPAGNVMLLVCLFLLYSGLLLRNSEISARGCVAVAAGAEATLILSAIAAGRLLQASIAVMLLVASWFACGGRHRSDIALADRKGIL